MQRQTTAMRWAERIIESGWLLAVVFTPYYFNLLTARHFEPDKAMVLRSLVLVMLAAWAIKTIERISVLRERIGWSSWWRAPLAIPALVFAAVFVLATFTSVQPDTSWWGSYQRGQGTYTNLSYMALFAVIVGNLRSREQLQRLLTTIILTGVSVSMYGLVQHNGYDPLPWKGDVLTRISSTMGNSIFVAAYLIMVLPWVLYRLTLAISRLRSAPRGEQAIDWTWLGFLGLLLAGQQALLFGVLKFMASVVPATGDFRYWWVLPAALVLIAGSFVLVSQAQTVRPNKTLSGLVLGGLVFWFLALLLVVASTVNIETVPPNAGALGPWWLWLLLGLAAMSGFLIASFVLPRREVAKSRVFVWGEIAAYAIALLVILFAIFFSQSRGPWIGSMAGIAVFVLLLLLRLIWTGSEQNWASLGRLRATLWGTIGLGLVGVAMLVMFNLSDAPFFERLRTVPYVGRLGRLLETDEGTGRVRTLIWFGDEQGGGAVGLLQSNLLRTLTLGHGPETMFTTFNPFYPPALAQYEQRGASPDRSHQAWLDELVTKGTFGLLSYFLLFGSAAWLAVRLVRRSTDLGYQLLSIAALAAIVAHFVEVLVGIPIVSTLTMVWVSFGILVVGGLLDGLYTLAGQPVAMPVVEAEAVSSKPAGRNANQRKGARAGAGGRSAILPNTTTQRGGFGWTYPVLLILALGLSWFWNLKINYADMFLNQAQAFGARTLAEQAYAYTKVLRAVEIEPSEDYYYLQLGNAILRMVYPEIRSRQTTFDASTAPRPDQRLEDLFAPQGDAQRMKWLADENTTEQMLEYARLVLERAVVINPGNKDHPANLGRLHAQWAQLPNAGPPYRQRAIEWFERAHKIAPNDATILNEIATNLALQGDIAAAEARFKESLQRDPGYAETYIRLAELYRLNGRIAEAGPLYAAAVERNRSALDADGRRLDRLLGVLKEQPAIIADIHAAYEAQKERYDRQRQQALAQGQQLAPDVRFLSQLGRVRAAAGDVAGMRAVFDEIVQTDPENVTYRQLYTLVLSDTLQFDAALQQAQKALDLAQQQQLTTQAADLQRLIDMMRKKAGG